MIRLEEPTDPFRSLAGRYFTKAPTSIEKAMKCIGGEVERRLQQVDQYGSDYPDKPVCSEAPTPSLSCL